MVERNILAENNNDVLNRRRRRPSAAELGLANPELERLTSQAFMSARPLAKLGSTAKPRHRTVEVVIDKNERMVILVLQIMSGNELSASARTQYAEEDRANPQQRQACRLGRGSYL